jgi:hypothetical protein
MLQFKYFSFVNQINMSQEWSPMNDEVLADALRKRIEELEKIKNIQELGLVAAINKLTGINIYKTPLGITCYNLKSNNSYLKIERNNNFIIIELYSEKDNFGLERSNEGTFLWGFNYDLINETWNDLESLINKLEELLKQP